jgi:hypothetical protein
MFFYSEPEQYSATSTIVVPLHLTSSFNSLNFPSTCIGTSSLLSVYVSAAELAGATVEIVSVGDDSDQFDQTPLSFALTGGVTSQLIDITFTPTSWGLKTANLILSASNGSVINVSMQGMAAAVPLILTSSVNSLSFGTTTVNTTSSMNVVISAGGFTSVKETVTLSDDSNQFSFSPASFELTGSGTSKTVAVTYSPTITGSVTGTLTLSSSGGNTKLISLGGSGLAPAQTDIYSASVSLLLKGDGINNSRSIIDSSVNNYAITAVGDTKISTSSSRNGGSSIYFDGASDICTTPDNNAFTFTGDFTIESWIRPVVNKAQTVVSHWYNGVSTLCSFGLQLNSVGAVNFSYGIGTSNVAIASTAGAVVPNQWTHVAVARAGTSLKLFINGQVVATKVASGAFNNCPNVLTVGAYNGDWYNGYIEDLRLTKGVARYTTNFTPPVDM